MIRPLWLVALLPGPPSPPPALTVVPPAALVLEVGGTAEARLDVSVREGFHVQANPASEPYLVPLRLELGRSEAVRVGQAVYPTGKRHRLRGASSDLSVYHGSFGVRVYLAAEPSAAAGEARLSGALHYQACNDRVCLRPASVPVELAVRLVAPREQH